MTKPLTDVLAEALRDVATCGLGIGLFDEWLADKIRAALARYEAEKAAPNGDGFAVRTLAAEFGYVYTEPVEDWLRRRLERLAKADPQPALTKCIHCGCYDHGAGNWDCQGNPKWTAQFQPAPSSAEVRAEIRDECERRAEEHAGIAAPACLTCHDKEWFGDGDTRLTCPSCKPTGGTS